MNRNTFMWVLIAIAVVFLFNSFNAGGNGNRDVRTTLPYTVFLKQVDEGRIADVTLTQAGAVSGHYRDGSQFKTTAPRSDTGLVNRLEQRGVTLTVAPPEEGIPTILAILINWFPMLLLIGVWLFFMRQMQGGKGGGGGAMGFGKSRAKMMTQQKGVKFTDVAGIDEAKQELQEVVDFLIDPSKFQRLGGKIPKGVLLVGPPGTGKTLTARAVAGEAGVPFFTISGSDFVEMFVGVGASRVRDMFEQGKKNAPCIIFIDELDAVGRHRGAGLGGGNDEREQTLNQMLVEMDGFESSEGVILIAATNRPDVLDPALLRPGRFDRQVTVPNPDIKGREKILHVHLKNVPCATDVDAKVIARGTPGFSGADLANLVNEAALLAARRDRRMVTMQELEDAKDKVMMGAERRSMVMGDAEKRLTAYHEAGHAIAAIHCPQSDPIHKATIIPRGRALGMVMRLPEKDELSIAYDKLMDNLVVGMGGRIAEEMIFGKEKITTGASSDIQMVTNQTRRMVTEWGYSDKLGTIRYTENQQEVFLGHSVAQSQNMSEKTAELIDAEVRRIVDEATERCRKILKKHKGQLEQLAQALLEHETLNGEEIQDLLAGKPINKEKEPETPKKRASVPTDQTPDGTEIKAKGAKKAKPKKTTPKKPD